MVVRRQCRRVLFPVVAILLASTARTSAQTGVAPDEVGVIEIDVSVVDRGGRPVSGLARESFDVTLDGELLAVIAFSAGEEPRQLALFFDESGFDAAERDQLSRRLTDSLFDDLPPGTRFMVAGRAGPDLRIYQPFTQRSELLIPAIDLASRSAGRTVATEEEETVEYSADVAERLVRLMAGMPGRAAVLYVGDSPAAEPGELPGDGVVAELGEVAAERGVGFYALETVSDSGGPAFARPEDGVAEALADMTALYSIGVRVPGTDARPTQPLTVTVEEDGLTVHQRRASRSRSVDERDADRTLAALFAGPGENRIGASVDVGEIDRTKSELFLVPVAVRVPVADLAVVAHDRAHDGQLTLFLATRDAGWRVSEVRKAMLPVRIANEELATVAGGQAEYRVDLRLPVGPARIAVGVRDDNDPDLALLTVELEVGADGAPAS